MLLFKIVLDIFFSIRPSCFVVGCKSGYGGTRGVHVFKVPAKASDTVRRLWIQNIPKRRDRDFDFKTCYVCEKHFHEEFIIKKIVINATLNLVVDRKRWTLTPNAKPTNFRNASIPSYLESCPRGRPPPVTRKLRTPKVKTATGQRMLTNYEATCETPFDVISDGMKIQLPNQWSATEVSNGITFNKLVRVPSADVETFITERFLYVSKDPPTSQVKIRGKVVNVHLPVIDSEDNFEKCIRIVDELKICAGAGTFGIFRKQTGAFCCGNIWFSSNCDSVTESKSCSSCLNLRQILVKSAATLIKNIRQNNETRAIRNKTCIQKIRKKCAARLRKLNKLRKRNRFLEAEFKSLKAQFRSVELSSIKDTIERSELLTPQLKLALKTAASHQKAKGPSGRRYT